MARVYGQKFKRWQEKHVGLSKDTQLKLDKLIKKFEKTNSLNYDLKIKVQEKRVIEGTKFIREYRGKKHEVIAIKKGFLYKNKEYKSLSAIANDITGTRWNN